MSKCANLSSSPSLLYLDKEVKDLIYASLSPMDCSQFLLVAGIINTEKGTVYDLANGLQFIFSSVVQISSALLILATLGGIKGILFPSINDGNAEGSIITEHPGAPWFH